MLSSLRICRSVASLVPVVALCLTRQKSESVCSISPHGYFRSCLGNLYQVFDKNSERNIFSRNSKWNFYHTSSIKKLARFEISRQVLGEIDDVISWTARISRLVSINQPEEALWVFRLMLINNNRPNYVTFLSVIRAVAVMDWEEMTWAIHCVVIKLGFESEVSIATALLGLYSVRDMAVVWQLFNQIPNKDLLSWSVMINLCSKFGNFDQAVVICKEMQSFGVEPNHVGILSILRTCADVGALLSGKQIHAYSIRREFDLFTNVQNSLMDMYMKCGNLETSVTVFNGIQKKDVVSWNIMILGCIEHGWSIKALELYLKMQLSYCEPDEVTICYAFGACSQEEELKFGFGLHCHVLKNGLLAAVSVGTALLRMYADCGDLEAAEVIFNHLHQKDLIAWSAMISVYAKAGFPDHALNTFKQMQLANEKPNEITLVSLLQACSSIEAQDLGKNIHGYALRHGYSSNAFIISALIDLYCKFGSLSQGKALFDNLPTKDLICWSSMIKGFGINGCGKEALKTFSDMLDCGTAPNDVVFISVLSACSHSGLEDEGWRWFYSMEANYHITPKLAHYACMVDMLSRQGCIKEAFEFVNNMPFEPDTSVWGALLAGCRSTQGTIEVAEFAAEHLLSSDNQNTSYYVMLSNLYAEHGQWKDAERLRMLVNEKGLRKTAGYSMIETT